MGIGRFRFRRVLAAWVFALVLTATAATGCGSAVPQPVQRDAGVVDEEVVQPTPSVGAQGPAAPAGGMSDGGHAATHAVSISAAAATDVASIAKSFDEERALEHVAHLAGAALEGRQPGTPGGRAAGSYIAEQFAAYGLEPAGVDATYYQTFTVPYGRITETPVLTITSAEGRVLGAGFDYRTDYRALTGGYVGAGHGEGPVVWLNECRHEDYAGLNVVGKVVFCRAAPDTEVYRQAIEHQVGGLLLLDRDADRRPLRRGGYRDTAWVPETIPAYLISERVGRELLAGTDYTLDSLTLRYTATPLSTTVRMELRTEEEEAVDARNVLGLLPGSDPAHAQEVVVLGAHYDHLGREPDGAIMHGANDNASGVAAVLEIARTWQAAGLRPARSVLFAAWDGEEQGLLGSRHYVENPTQSITQTMAMLNLDMVGAGEVLRLDGDGLVAQQLTASAEAYGVTYTTTIHGRSDHVPFDEAGVPAAMLIWWPDKQYHTPDDTPSGIDPGKLKTVGVLSSHALAAIAQTQVELERAVENLEASVAAGDREGFAGLLTEAEEDARRRQLDWFDHLWAQDLTGIHIDPRQVRLANDARMVLRVAPRWTEQPASEPSASYTARFRAENGSWAFAGPDYEEVSGRNVTVAWLPGSSLDVERALSVTERAYVSITQDLDHQPSAGTRFIIYRDAETLRAVADPTAAEAVPWRVPSSNAAEIVMGPRHQEVVTPAVVSLVLNQMGLPPGQAAWLRKGLAARYESDAESTYLPVLTGPEASTSLDARVDERFFDTSAGSVPGPAVGDGWTAGDDLALRAHGWSAVEYLLDVYGQDGLQSLAAAWGAGGAADAFQEGLGVTVEAFAAAWRRSHLDPLRAAGEGIRETLAERERSLLEGDRAAFISSVSPSDPQLGTEESWWFTALTGSPPASRVLSYSVDGQVIGWAPDAEEVLVSLQSTTVVTGHPPLEASHRVRFNLEKDRWRYAGEQRRTAKSEHFVLRLPPESQGRAGEILASAEEIYERVTADLQVEPPLPQILVVHADRARFGHSTAYVLPKDADSWTAEGQPIRLCAASQDCRGLEEGLARELTRQILYAQGVESAWIHAGVGALEVDRVLPLGVHWGASSRERRLREALGSREELSWSELGTLDALPQEDRKLARAQSWSWIDKLVREHGPSGLRKFLRGVAKTGDARTALQNTLAIEPGAFVEEWEEEIQSRGAPPGLLSIARAFDAGRAMDHVKVLSSPAFAGREAGSPGGAQAAAYIAGQFSALGLTPLGEGLSLSPDATATVSHTAVQSYLHPFAISYTAMMTVPSVALLEDEPGSGRALAYRRDFVDLAGKGVGEGELVWLSSREVEGLRFDEAIVLQEGADNPLRRAHLLREHGAGGLILVGERSADELRSEPAGARGRISADTLPVVELSEEGFESLMDGLGVESEALSSAVPALPLGSRARVIVPRTPMTTVETCNVLGLWPGRDPELSSEVLIVGAHYDHLGRLPDGAYFPGANQNASGIAAMLELINLWQQEGYQPARSVLFAAWGAEERDSAGVAHYLADPIVPLTRTVGVVSLDAIADGGGYRLWILGDREKEAPLSYRLEASAAQLKRDAWRKGVSHEGWHALFGRFGMPSVKLTWAESEDLAYRLDDTVEKMDPTRLVNSGEILTLAVSWLAGE